MKKIFFVLATLLIFDNLFSLPLWETEDFIRAEFEKRPESVFQDGIPDEDPEWQRWSYIHQFFKTCDFIKGLQVSDSASPEFGGMIEGENAMNIVETDNTQEAIWVWSRYKELTGDTTYDINIIRAWLYVLLHPAYNEEGAESDYYRVWNCGLALFAEGKYREVTGDSSFIGYADSCIGYMFRHPLPFTGVGGYYGRLHPKTTSLAAGMLYQYGKKNNIPECVDTALVYGERVISWLEENPGQNLNDEIWAMSGGTAVWGITRSLFEEDSLRGREWLWTYIRFMKYLAPFGQWNNSWNIWYANAYNFSGRIMKKYRYRLFHHSLTDSLLVQDRDNDGGVPPTKGDSQNGDHSWVSTYMVFMGFEGLMDSIRNFDAGVIKILSPTKEHVFLPFDTIDVSLLCANYGFNAINITPVSISLPFNYDSTVSLPLGAVDTITFHTQWVPIDTGRFSFNAFSHLANDERTSNDTSKAEFRIREARSVSGFVKDSVTGSPIKTELFFTIRGDSGENFFTSVKTDSLTGEYSIMLFDSVFSVEVLPEIPYPDVYRDSALVSPDTFWGFDFLIDPAALLLVNRDKDANYSIYFSENLDSLDVSYVLWEVKHQGLPPFSIMNSFGTRTIIWFSGDSDSNTVSVVEQDSLVSFLNGGGNLFLTGQNIAEELTGSVLLDNYVHSDFDANTDANILLGVSGDPIGNDINVYIVGGVPNNQVSQEILLPLAGADSAFTYLGGGTGAVRYDSGSYKTLLFGFGFEAINSAGTFASRQTVMERVLNWFGIETGDEETANYQFSISNYQFSVYPNPFREKTEIKWTLGTGHSALGENPITNDKCPMTISIYDVSGRLVKNFSLPTAYSLLPNRLSWGGRGKDRKKLPSGVYFAKLSCGEFSAVKKLILVR
ncbi:MAG: T9SS type A sorting domain-containing protein [Candidatus Cloacimonadota bacterium]|nr:MAG: T9SS type A sorting domain-containing protein [Candidatus Cloacimonadota bacterium]